MPDAVHVDAGFTHDELIHTRWVFGRRLGKPLTATFYFGENGQVEQYKHDNEVTWKATATGLEIYRINGALMWRSERMYRNESGRRFIDLRTPFDAAVEFVLSEYAPPMTAADFLFPTELEIVPTTLQRVLLTGSCLSRFYQEEFARLHPETKIDFIVFNFASKMPAVPPAPVAEYDLQYIQLPLRSIISDRIVGVTSFNDPGVAEEILANGCNVIDVMLDAAMAYNVAHGLLAIVSNFFVPQMGVASSLGARHGERDLSHIVRRLNEHLAQAVSRYRNAYLADVNAVADSIGKRYLLDDMIYFYSHGALIYQDWHDFGRIARVEPIPPLATVYESKQDDFVKAVFAQMKSICRTVCQIDQVKAVVFDLDNTLWRGQLAEDYRADQRPWPRIDGWPMGLWEAIHHLRARGILVAICSKNDLATVQENWDNIGTEGFLRLEDFASVKINWLTKAENIAAICREFNVKPKSVVFVDDNPVERGAVKAALPDIRTIGGNPYLTRRILLWAAETQVATLTNESSRRENMVRSQVVREENRVAMSREQFLATLDCKMNVKIITSLAHADAARAMELINKTNQFNTTGKRWSHAEIGPFLDGGGSLFTFTVVDKFAEYGLVGVLLLKDRAIVQFVMSCRVLGMEVEEAAVAEAVKFLRKQNEGPIAAVLKVTPDNAPCRDVYARCGFVLLRIQDDESEYRLATDATPRAPAHVLILHG